ncbi:chemotaxis protein CheA [Celeribacter marinus]|uniref:chemotaxis protein CheA n=1 Tax=Celeribacter marinus TaxID=1397108 RepID=UPI00317C14A7
MSDPMAEIRASFFVECEELLESLNDGLQMMDDGATDSETINVVFRAVHSIKGGAGAFGLDDLVRFAHQFETAMDEVRAGRFTPGPDAIRLFYACTDILGDLVRAARDGEVISDDITGPALETLTRLVGIQEEVEEEIEFTPATLSLDLDLDFDALDLSADLGGDMTDPLPELSDLGALEDADTDLSSSLPTPAKGFRVFLKPENALYASGNEPLYLFRALRDLGDISITCHTDALPVIGIMDPEVGYLSWTIEVHTDEPETAVVDVFEFVDGLCQLSITPLDAPLAHTVSDDTQSDADQADTAPPPEMMREPESQASDGPPVEIENLDTPLLAPLDVPTIANDPLIDAAQTPEVAAPVAAMIAPATPAAAPLDEDAQDERKTLSAPTQPRATVRVDLERIDRLVNLVGELVINQAMLSQSVAEAHIPPNSPVSSGLEEFLQLTRDIQESVMMIRAQPIKSLFQRMGRIVRESSASVGKEVRLTTIGENTEVDKTVIERLADPLTHMIRNAVDHGLETPKTRTENGKSAIGHVTLSAQHRSERIVIEVSDDGAGINRERVRAKAIENGLILPDAQLSDSDIDNLLFMPGFSTASEISNLSGRGVGMDVVKSAIQGLGGRIAITSVEGKGTTFSISLPLTLAVLDGMVVRVENETIVVPLNAILETLTLTDDDFESLGPQSHVVQIRGGFVPLLDLGAELGYRAPEPSYVGRVVLLIGQEGGNRAALAVDAIEDQRQVVIKGLEGSYGRIPGIAAATILGDGQIALILDPGDLVAQASGRTKSSTQTPALVG